MIGYWVEESSQFDEYWSKKIHLVILFSDNIIAEFDLDKII